MLKISDRSTPACIVVDVDGAVTGDEYEEFVDALEDAAEKNGRLNLVVNLLGSVKYGDKDAMEEDWEFFTKGYKGIRRAAFVGDTHVVKTLVKLFSPFTRAEEEFFSAAELDAAIEWASAAD